MRKDKYFPFNKKSMKIPTKEGLVTVNQEILRLSEAAKNRQN